MQQVVKVIHVKNVKMVMMEYFVKNVNTNIYKNMMECKINVRKLIINVKNIILHISTVTVAFLT